jgi:hypothetical protein
MILKFPMRKDRSSLLICAHALTWKTWWKSKGCRISRFFWGRRSEIRQACITALIRFDGSGLHAVHRSFNESMPKAPTKTPRLAAPGSEEGANSEIGY